MKSKVGKIITMFLAATAMTGCSKGYQATLSEAPTGAKVVKTHAFASITRVQSNGYDLQMTLGQPTQVRVTPNGYQLTGVFSE